MPGKNTGKWIKTNLLFAETNFDTRLLSYKILRRIIGLLGILLPLILWLGEFILLGEITPRKSISDYYFSEMRNIFVGIIWTFGVFLFCYKGYEWVDNLAATIGGICAIGVALFPVPKNFKTLPIHFIFALGFFIILVIFCLVFFTKSNMKNPGKQKIKRNRLYKLCGLIMIILILLIILYIGIYPNQDSFLSPYKPVFFLETLLLFTFGIAWLVKGETFLSDKNDNVRLDVH